LPLCAFHRDLRQPQLQDRGDCVGAECDRRGDREDAGGQLGSGATTRVRTPRWAGTAIVGRGLPPPLQCRGLGRGAGRLSSPPSPRTAYPFAFLTTTGSALTATCQGCWHGVRALATPGPRPPSSVDLGVVVGQNRALCRERATTTPRSTGRGAGRAGCRAARGGAVGLVGGANRPGLVGGAHRPGPVAALTVRGSRR
jgi:hypothetical protein